MDVVFFILGVILFFFGGWVFFYFGINDEDNNASFLIGGSLIVVISIIFLTFSAKYVSKSTYDDLCFKREAIQSYIDSGNKIDRNFIEHYSSVEEEIENFNSKDDCFKDESIKGKTIQEMKIK